MGGAWSVTVRAALRAFGEVGVDVDVLCARCGLDPTALADVDARVPLPVAGRLWPEGARLFGRPGLGLHAGTALPFGELESLDYAFACADTLEQGLARVARWFDVVTGGATGVRLHEVGGERRLVYTPLPVDDLRDYGVALFVSRLRWAGVTPVRVELRGEPAAPVDEYARAFSCPVRFSAAESAVVLDEESARRPLPTSLPGLREVVDRELGRALARARDEPDALQDVRGAIRVALGSGGATLAQTARRLGVGARTLQRRLSSLGTTFQAVVDEERTAAAIEHLREDRLSIAEIAFLLGYSEPSAFSRAFLRATGERPAELRARARAVTRRAPSADRAQAGKR